MTYDELDEYIKRYIENDRTNRAIILTGAWGCGKSYYIQNHLIPFLENLKQEKQSKHQCVVVSLYGLNDLSEISKRIYLELRTIGKKKASEAKTTGTVAVKVVGKTLLNGLTSKIGFDIGSISDKDLNKVYKSVNLKDKLIIFEDLERSGVDLIDFMGYINNFTEQDGVKVLLVANEDEFLKYKEEDKQDHYGLKSKIRVPAPLTEKYLSIKEKTVVDTIHFEPDAKAIIRDILKQYSPELDSFCSDSNTKVIADLLRKIGNKFSPTYNFRTFVYACQKASELFGHFTVEPNTPFCNAVFFGIISFVVKYNGDQFPKRWDGYGEMSRNYVSGIYPLFNFCYEYIVAQSFNKESVSRAIAEYRKEYEINGQNGQNDEDLNIICYYWLKKETEVREATGNILRKLKKGDEIAIDSFNKVVCSLIRIKHLFGFDDKISTQIEDCKKLMLEKIKNMGEQLNFYHPRVKLESNEEKEEFASFKKAAEEALKAPKEEYSPISYDVEKVSEDFDRGRAQLHNGAFCALLDREKFIVLLMECSSENINIIREYFLAIYRSFSTELFSDKELPALIELKEAVDKCRNRDIFDKIQKLQLRWFSDNLGACIEYLEEDVKTTV